MSGAVHDVAAVGFDRAGDVYDRARPGYPEPIVEAILAAVPAPARVCDLAAGTGKLTRALAGRTGTLIAAEPVAGMRRLLAAGGFVTVGATAERLPFADRSLDGVTVAQAFHWFDADAALAEIHRVLVPGGVLAIAFNVRDDEVDWVRRLWDRLDLEEASHRIPRHLDRGWEPVLRLDGRFAPEGEQVIVFHGQEMDADGLVDRVASVSFVASMDEDGRARVENVVRDLVATDPELAGREIFTYPYRCELSLYRRT